MESKKRLVQASPSYGRGGLEAQIMKAVEKFWSFEELELG